MQTLELVGDARSVAAQNCDRLGRDGGLTVRMKVVAGLLAAVLAGCTATTAGVARKAVESADSDGVIVSLLDTGAYPVAGGHPYGSAGDRSGNVIESQRMAEYVIGPWQVDSSLRLLNVFSTAVMLPATVATTDEMFPDVLGKVALAHGFLAGFTTTRASTNSALQRGLQNVVLRFPDPQAAAVAAEEMAAVNIEDSVPRQPAVIQDHPAAIAWAYQRARGDVEVYSFAARGPFVLSQGAGVNHEFDNAFQAELLIARALDQQEQMIDRFVPTDPAKLVNLAMDPSGWLLAHVLWAADKKAPYSVGVYPPTAVLHFEQDPVDSEALFTAADVEWVGQRLARVYQTKSAAGAQRVAAKLAEQARIQPNVNALSTPISGLPAGKCFVRSRDFAPPTDPDTLQQHDWHFTCIARADRFAYQTFSQDLKDAMQQAAAQWRILAGK